MGEGGLGGAAGVRQVLHMGGKQIIAISIDYFWYLLVDPNSCITNVVLFLQHYNNSRVMLLMGKLVACLVGFIFIKMFLLWGASNRDQG